jgi:Domain of unknown function (DUF4258)
MESKPYKVIRWSSHALRNLADREIARAQADRTVAAPEVVVPGQAGRRVCMRRYFDAVLPREMLLRVVLEDTLDETVVVTLYQTSQIDRYMKGPIS